METQPDQQAQQRAERCAQLMMAQDAATRGLGMVLEHIAPGHAVLSLQIEPRMLNGHSICHGGVIFALTDSAFAFACNSYNQLTVAQQNQITYLAPGHAGDRLIATAHEISRSGRSGVYDVTVTNDRGAQIALMRGLSRTIKGQHYPEGGDHP